MILSSSCLLCRALWRYPLPWGPMLSSAVFCGVPPRCVALVFCGVVQGLVARGCLLVACFGVDVPVWPRGLLPRGWCGLLWCPASLCRVLWCCAVAWCCAVVLCCRFAVLFVFALPFCGLSCCAMLCCGVLLVVCGVFRPPLASVCCGALPLPAGMHKKH